MIITNPGALYPRDCADYLTSYRECMGYLGSLPNCQWSKLKLWGGHRTWADQEFKLRQVWSNTLKHDPTLPHSVKSIIRKQLLSQAQSYTIQWSLQSEADIEEQIRHKHNSEQSTVKTEQLTFPMLALKQYIRQSHLREKEHWELETVM